VVFGAVAFAVILAAVALVVLVAAVFAAVFVVLVVVLAAAAAFGVFTLAAGIFAAVRFAATVLPVVVFAAARVFFSVIVGAGAAAVAVLRVVFAGAFIAAAGFVAALRAVVVLAAGFAAGVRFVVAFTIANPLYLIRGTYVVAETRQIKRSALVWSCKWRASPCPARKPADGRCFASSGVAPKPPAHARAPERDASSAFARRFAGDPRTKRRAFGRAEHVARTAWRNKSLIKQTGLTKNQIATREPAIFVRYQTISDRLARAAPRSRARATP
jgi:hypothetical protein